MTPMWAKQTCRGGEEEDVKAGEGKGGEARGRGGKGGGEGRGRGEGGEGRGGERKENRFYSVIVTNINVTTVWGSEEQ